MGALPGPEPRPRRESLARRKERRARRMRRARWQAAGYALVLLLMAPIAFLGPSYLLSTHTPHCPLRHKLSDDWYCIVVARGDAGRELIQHALLQSSERYLELRGPEGSRYLALPDEITELAPHGYQARLLPGEPHTVVLNGRPYRLPEPR